MSLVKSKIHLPFWLQKIVYFEFWPVFILYFPVFIYICYLSIRAKSFTFFTLANPGIFLGGIQGESKSDILQKIDPVYLPHSIFIPANADVFEVLKRLKNANMDYPVIVKPDIGERGKQVEKIENVDELTQYLSKNRNSAICQEFIDYPIELGVLFYQYPMSHKFGISSIVQKEFLQVVGDGKSNLNSLIYANDRAHLQLDYLLKKFESRLGEVLAESEIIVLEPIGNHCRGTKFLNGQSLISLKLEEVFRTISKDIPGFYIGRYDLKVKSLDDLLSGKNIRILELNGISSEPAHIYQPRYSLRAAYKALFHHVFLIYEIALENKQRGFEFISIKAFYKALKTQSLEV